MTDIGPTMTLTFDLDDPRQRLAAERALKADDLAAAIAEYDEWLRSQIKYYGRGEELQESRDQLYAICGDNGVGGEL